MKSLNHCNGKARGFTLMELLIVIGLFIFLGAMAAIIGVDSVSRTNTMGERDLLVTLLWGERARALANVDALPHGLYIDTDSIVLFEGSTYDASDPENRVVNRDTLVSISGPDTIIFEELSGRVTSGTGDITLTQGSKTATISINDEGRIDW